MELETRVSEDDQNDYPEFHKHPDGRITASHWPKQTTFSPSFLEHLSDVDPDGRIYFDVYIETDNGSATYRVTEYDGRVWVGRLLYGVINPTPPHEFEDGKCR